MTAPAIVVELVERFDAHRPTYQSGQYNEAQLRAGVHQSAVRGPGLGRLQPQGLRRRLQGGHPRGRDPDRRPDQGAGLLLPRRRRHAELLRRGQEAVGRHSRRRRPRLPASPLRLVGQAAGERPDRLRGVRRLRLPHPAGEDRQGVRGPGHLSHATREYLDRWDELVGLFSPEAIRRGSIERFVAGKKIKKGTAEVDAAFLAEIESWRLRAGAEPRPAQPGHFAARPELRRAADHRPHRVPADLRGPRDRALRHAADPAERARTSTAGWASCSSGPTTATTRACSISRREGPPRAARRTDARA